MKVIGYVRVSTEEQAREEISLEAQEAKIKSYAELHSLGKKVKQRREKENEQSNNQD